jgi:hypothetical protein
MLITVVTPPEHRIGARDSMRTPRRTPETIRRAVILATAILSPGRSKGLIACSVLRRV